MQKPKRLISFLRRLFHAKQAHRLDAYSAQSAFFIFLSFFPFLMLLFSLLRRFPNFEEIRDSLVFLPLPQRVSTLLSALLQEVETESSGTVLGVSVFGVLWSASKGAYGVLRGLFTVYGRKRGEGYASLRLFGLAFTLLFLFFLMGVLVLFLFGKTLLKWLAPNFGHSGLFSLLRSFSVFSLLSFFFLLLFRVVRGQKTKLLLQLPGAVFTALGWVVFTWLFTLYTDCFGGFSKLYGSLTAVILLMLWLYFCVSLLFYGAEINRLLEPDFLLFLCKKEKKKKGVDSPLGG